MINLYFNCEKQILTRTDREDLASNSREIHRCNFTLSNDWDDMQITAVFMYMGRKWAVMLDDNACTVPAEVLGGVGGFAIGLYGTNGNQVITSTLLVIPVSKGACVGGSINAQITPSMFDQIMAKIEEIEEGQVDPEAIEAAIEEYLRENPDAVINTSEVYNAITRSRLMNLIPKYTDYRDGLEKTDATPGVSYYVLAPGHMGTFTDNYEYGRIAITVMAPGASRTSVFYLLKRAGYLPEGKYKLTNAWQINDPGTSIIYGYIAEGAEHILAEVTTANELVEFEITPEIIDAGYEQILYIKLSEGAVGGELFPLLTYGDVTDFDNVPEGYVENNEELTKATLSLKADTTDLQGRMLNVEIGKQDKTQYAVIPAASVDLLGKTYQYTGATSANYTEGHWYKCVENGGVYSWEDIGPNTPNITMTATVDNTSGTPQVNVTKTGTDEDPHFNIALTGIKGAQGAPGATGKSAYEVAVDNGYAGTEEQWLASLQGPPGPDSITDADWTQIEAILT